MSCKNIERLVGYVVLSISFWIAAPAFADQTGSNNPLRGIVDIFQGALNKFGDAVDAAAGSVTALPDTNLDLPLRTEWSPMTSLAGGQDHVLYLHPDGTLWGWGSNAVGQLGIGAIDQERSNAETTIFTHPVGPFKKPQKLPVTEVVVVAAGPATSIVLRKDGTVWSFGNNDDGVLGTGTRGNSPVPSPVKGLSHIVAIAAGEHFFVALDSSGHVWGWGWNNAYALGLPDQAARQLSPARIKGISGVTAIAATASGVIALRSDGSVWGWGGDLFVFNGTRFTGEFNRDPALPGKIDGLSDVASVYGGYNSHVPYVIKTDGSVWILTSKGPGDGNGFSRFQIRQVPGLKKPIKQVSPGWEHILVLTTDGEVMAMGRNVSCEVGDGTQEERPTFGKAKGLRSMNAVFAGFTYSVALGQDGALYGFGSNRNDVLRGLGNLLCRPTRLSP